MAEWPDIGEILPTHVRYAGNSTPQLVPIAVHMYGGLGTGRETQDIGPRQDIEGFQGNT
jgi:hypothetical protein